MEHHWSKLGALDCSTLDFGEPLVVVALLRSFWADLWLIGACLVAHGCCKSNLVTLDYGVVLLIVGVPI